ncbi:MAG: Rieske 2Fe-2S domain-containing protein [Candidatus Omnitrophota bacterium]|nr:Rieske 2Fe-2S domain-containing protein [Candidatus Omnitrophota bacterium]
MAEKKITRRQFINYILGGSLLGLAASAAYSIFRYITPPEGSETAVLSVVAGKSGELTLNSGKIFRFGVTPGLLINTAKGELLAFNAVCTHLNCTVQYDPQAICIWCPCHNGRFDLNGKVISGPPPRPLEKYLVNIRGDDIVVSKNI